MKSNEYIISELEKIIIKFPNIRIRYENYDSNTHFLEITPNLIISDKDYINCENEFFNNFISKFPNQNICFLSDDSIVGLFKIDYEIKGDKFIDLFE